ncbi:MAG: glycosyltransferase, partial [Chitinophagaceae bacterium]|nr:glycosyltransferase [Chitinophagaceae bacterium]
MAIFILILFLLLIAYGFLIDHYRKAWNELSEFSGGTGVKIRASVIVAVRNEERNIGKLLDCLVAQNYPSYEIIIVDDHSTDNTVNIVKEYPSVKIISLPENIYGKKNAIKEGIKNSTGELIITTDADCTMQPLWINTVVSFHHFSDAKFIAAPVNMKPGRSILSIFQSLDFLTLQGITG